MHTYNQLIHLYRDEFRQKNISLETVKLFLFELCNEFEINLYLEMDRPANEALEEKFHAGVKRLLNDEPLNYVLGYSYFYGYKMLVDDRVLIPRYETEELVGLILSKYDEHFKGQDVEVCDVGTGSGAIAIALKLEEPHMHMHASDISSEAIEVAKQNAANNQADVQFMLGSMLEPLIEKGMKLDILVSNPPYIPQEENMEKSVVDYEPHVALFGGNDGLKFYRMIFEGAMEVMKEKGFLFFEMGWDQRERLSALAKTYFPNATIEVFKDINQKDRMLMVQL